MKNLRIYCERIAKACPERFSLEEDEIGTFIYDGPWVLVDFTDARKCWEFIGPICDELGILRLAPKYHRTGPDKRGCYKNIPYTLLEAAFAAVADKLEEPK